MLPFCRSRKSFFDAIAGRRVAKALRTFAFLEMMCLAVLFYQYLTVGNPIYLHAALDYGNGDSWLYGYGRPSAGVIFIGLGLFGALYPVPRTLCILGCVVQIVCDGISAFQIRDYYRQVLNKSAPGNGYSEQGLMVYYWRDIVSIALTITVLMLACFLSTILGWCDPQLIHPSQVTGNDADRFDAMHRMRLKRKQMENAGIVEKPLLPIFHKKISDFKLKNEDDEEEKERSNADEEGAERTLKKEVAEDDVESERAMPVRVDYVF
ncbi:hypothetical protein EON65_36615 [archaeon]|nr:MAG: hypothetical protein EON65_36615 [archaeon]